MISCTYLIFGDLHGRVLPAFRLALAWQREHGERLDGLLQVGDLGYFPDASRLDKATKRHAERDPLELGTQLIAVPSREADTLFAEPDLPQALWFTAGNHEDYDALEALARGPGAGPDDFSVDCYGRVFCLRDGHVASLPGGLCVGALWGIDGEGPNARRKADPRGRIRQRSAWNLCLSTFDVLLTHDSPPDVIYPGSGCAHVRMVLEEAKPAFAFFGHYHPGDRLVFGEIGPTRYHHLHGLEFHGRGGSAEAGSVGVLRKDEQGSCFEYLSPDWLRTVTRHNWQHR
jgi:hypothetical protein